MANPIRAQTAPARRLLRAAVVLVSGRILVATIAASLVAPVPTAAQDIEKPRLRLQYFRAQRAYPFGEIPPGAFQAAVRQAQSEWPELMVPQARLAEEHAWTPIGPDNIPGLSIQSAGRLTAIALHPDEPATIYIGAAQGGVWKTVDGGATWTPMTDKECSLAMGALALDPADPDIVYAGTGEQHFSADSYYGCGVLRSTDGGATWVQLGAATFVTATGGARISRLLIDPATAGSTTGTTLYVASDFGLYKSTDAGGTWTRMLEGVVTDLVMDPTDRLHLYAALGRVTTDSNNGVYRSTDGGESWSRLPNGFPASDVGRINLAMAPSDPAILYASIQTAFGQSEQEGTLLGIYRTTDGGANWARLDATGASCGRQCWYDMVLAVHPAGPDTVFFGGVPLFKSTNGGQSFPTIGGPIHVDQHAFVFDPRDPSTVYVGNDGGIYRSTNGGQTWTSLNTNLAITQFYAGNSLHPTDTGIALGGTQDNGTLRWNDSPSWQHVLGGDGGYTAIDHENPATAYAETQWTANSGFSGPRRSDGAGFVLKVNGIDRSDRALFIPPLVMDPSNPRVLYFGTFRLYRTVDRAESWASIGPGLGGNAVISAIAPAPSEPAVVYVGTSAGQVHRTDNGGSTWTNVSAGLPTRFITSIAVARNDSRTAFLTVSGFRSGHVFRTGDGGASWQDISANLPDLPVNTIALDPASPAILYLGTDLGMFRSLDGASSWQPFNGGFPNVAVFGLAVNPATGILVAATHGRGMFRASVGAATASIAGAVRYFGGERPPVAGAQMTGGGTATGQAPTTDPAGGYSIVGVTGTAAAVTPAKVGDRGSALSALDAAWVLQCAAGVRSCDGARAQAGDVSGDGRLDQEDAVILLEHLVGSRPGLPAGEWLFQPESRSYDPLPGPQSSQDFDAILVGDVTGSWQPAAAPAVASLAAAGASLAASGGAGQPRVSLVRDRDGAGDVIVAVDVRAAGETVLGVDAELELGGTGSVEVVSVEPGPAASGTGFLLTHRFDAIGRRLRFALASATGVSDGGILALVRLRTPAGATGVAVSVAAARVNEAAAAGDRAVAVLDLPTVLLLEQNVPNPFSAATGTRFTVQVPADDTGFVSRPVRVYVYDLRGVPVRRLLDGPLFPGPRDVQWDGRDDAGALVGSGIYIAVAESGGARSRVRAIFIR